MLQLLATGSAGGAQESYTGLLLHLDRSRYDVLALSLSAGSAVRRLRRLGVEIEVLDEPDDEAAVLRLAAYLRSAEIDLIHSHMYRAEVVGTRAAVSAGTPVIVSTVHSSRVRPPCDVDLLRALTPRIDRLIVPSEAIAAKLRAEGRGTVPITVIPNGIVLERFERRERSNRDAVRRELGVPQEDLLIGLVARLESEKGHRYLLDAVPLVLRECPGAWFVVVGEGSLERELREHAARLPAFAARRVIFTGRRDDVAAVTATLDVAVLPSLREAQGISLLEAMALRTPVVASAVGGIPEVITDGANGLLVPPRDGDRLAAAILRLATDPALRLRLGDAGYRTVAERYTIEAMVRRTEAVYDEELLRAGVTEPGAGRVRSPSPSLERAALEIPPRE